MFKTSALIVALCVSGLAVQQDGAKQKKRKKVDAESFNAVCPISGAPAKNSKKTHFGGGQVFFCCDKCLAKFNGMKAKMNHQLVMTKQVKQVSCPMSGKPVKEGMEVAYGGVKVGFCCGNCKGEAEKTVTEDKDAAILAMFTGKMFSTGFKTQRQIQQQKRREAAKKKEMKEKDADADK